MAEVRIIEYTDPGCPWAYSAEPFRLRLQWLYGDALEWHTRLVVLAEEPATNEDGGFTPEVQVRAFESIAERFGMPIDTAERRHVPATAPACRAVVAVREHDPAAARRLLRALRVHYFAADALLDDPGMLDLAAETARLDRRALEAWLAEPATEEALEADKAAARDPLPAALALSHKLADWPQGKRYTCPSYEIQRLSDGAEVAAPGFQPLESYEVALANLLPGTSRRADPQTVSEALEWAGTPLATQEVAVLTDVDRAEAREQLGRVARERHVGSDGFWSLD